MYLLTQRGAKLKVYHSLFAPKLSPDFPVLVCGSSLLEFEPGHELSALSSVNIRVFQELIVLRYSVRKESCTQRFLDSGDAEEAGFVYTMLHIKLQYYNISASWMWEYAILRMEIKF